MSELVLRPPEADDREELGRILYAAFEAIANRHGFPPDFASVQLADVVMRFLLDTSWGVVAERDGRIVGSNFLKEGDPIAAVGPISVDPEIQESGVGRRLMEAVIERGQAAHGVRLVQDAFNATSMALYASLGFVVREPLVCMGGTPRSQPPSDIAVRPLVADDLEACAALCQKVHGITRSGELATAIPRLGPYVAERDGRVTAYATTLGFWAGSHAVAEAERDLEALILGAAADSDKPVALLLPTRQSGLFRFALAEGLRIVKPMTLMSLGPYQEPAGSFLPSVGY